MKNKPIVTILSFIALLTNISANGQNTSVAVTTLSNCQTQIVTLVAQYGSPITYNLATNQILTGFYVNYTNYNQPTLLISYGGLDNITNALTVNSATIIFYLRG